LKGNALDTPPCFVPVEKPGIFATFRTDRWWIQPLIMAIILTGFGIYTIFVLLLEHGSPLLFDGEYKDKLIYYEDNGAHYISPISSPGPNAVPEVIKEFWMWPATLLFIWAPLGFRATCYYGRRVYYRAMFANPIAVAVDKPIKSYSGENSFPFILQNAHRYFLYLAILLAILHIYHAIDSFIFAGQFGIGLGSLLLTIDALFLSLYVSSCHSLRNLVGGNIDCISCANYAKKKGTSWVGYLNQFHGTFFWISLISIMVADFYIRIYLGMWDNPEIFLWEP
tara:strand:- start:407 stop:1249 length:843 start_codon:yes stop_codon:yes gene_type:complete